MIQRTLVLVSIAVFGLSAQAAPPGGGPPKAPGAAKTVGTDAGAAGMPEAARPEAPAAGKTGALGAKGEMGGTGKMIHCPAAVPGAKTKVKNLKDGVELTITSKDEASATEIRKRAEHLAQVGSAADTGKHDGEGGYGGGMGKCPVVMKDTQVTTEEVPGGSRIVLKPMKEGDLPALKKMVKERHRGMAARAQ